MDQEKKDKVRYMKEKEEFKHTPAQKSKSKTKSKGVKAGPKRAWPPFFFYQQERRQDLKDENPGLNHKEVVSKLGEEWRKLSEESKRPFVEKSTADQMRYEKEKKQFNDSKSDNVKDDTAEIKSKSLKPVGKNKEKKIQRF